jgi:polysaccharide export outer membrane protein
MPDGSVSVPLLGIIVAVGKTVPSLTEELTRRYQAYYKDPKVSVSATPRQPPQVYVEGSVRKPGPVDYAGHLRLSQYIGMAGGPEPGADLSQVVVSSGSGAQVTKTTYDLLAASSAQEGTQDPVLRPGDAVWVNRALPVSVVGAVNSPGAFDYQLGMRLSDYLGRAGGPTDHAAMDRVVVESSAAGQKTPRVVNMGASSGHLDDPNLNPPLAPGDVVIVPERFLAGTLDWSDVLRSVTSLFIFWHRS